MLVIEKTICSRFSCNYYLLISFLCIEIDCEITGNLINQLFVVPYIFFFFFVIDLKFNTPL